MIRKIIFAALLSLPLIASAEELAIIAAKNSPVSQLSAAEAQQLFSGQLRSLNGTAVQTLDLPSGNSDRNAFYQQLLGRTSDQMRSHWARLIFTGKARPPREVTSTGEMLSLVAGSADIIGYIPASAVSDKVKVLRMVK